MTEDKFGWSQPRHWRGGWLNIYANRDDPRLWVPKRRPGLGWTLNMLHPRAGLVLQGLVAFVAVVLLFVAAIDR